MKHIYLVIAMFLVSPGFAQVYVYQSIIPGSVNTLMYGTAETTTAYYHTGSSNSNDPFNGDIIVYKSNKLGTPLWSYTYGDSGIAEGGWGIRVASNGSLVVFAQRDFNGQNSEIVMLGLDTNGIILWNRSYGGSMQETTGQFTETPDGGFLIYGTTNSVGDGSWNLFTLKIDVNGNVLWDRVYGDPFSDYAVDVTITPDSGFMVVGNYVDFAGDRIHLLKLNSIGDTLWSKKLDGPEPFNIGGIQTIASGGYLITGRCDTTKGMAMRIDENGNNLWTRTYDNGVSVFINEAYEHSGGFILAGAYHDQSGTGNMFILQTDTLGYPLWSKAYGSPNADQVMSLLPTSDNGMMLTGASWGFSPGVHGYIIKTDDLGVSGCNESAITFTIGSAAFTGVALPISVMNGLSDTVLTYTRLTNPGYQNLCGVNVEEIFDENWNLFPTLVSAGQNPQLHSNETMHVKIFASDGKLVGEQDVQPSGYISLPATPGVYLVSLYDGNTCVGTQKIIRTE